MMSVARDDEPTTAMMAHHDNDSHARHMQGAPAVPSPPPHRQAHGPGTAPENGRQPRKARAPRTTMMAAHNSATMQTDAAGWQRGAARRVQGTATPNGNGGGPGDAKTV